MKNKTTPNTIHSEYFCGSCRRQWQHHCMTAECSCRLGSLPGLRQTQTWQSRITLYCWMTFETLLLLAFERGCSFIQFVKALKLAEMIPNLSHKTTSGFSVGNLFKMEVICFSLYTHIRNGYIHTYIHTGTLWWYWKSAPTFKYERVIAQ